MSTEVTLSNISVAVGRMRELGLNDEDVTREAGYALSIINGSQKLLKCSGRSIVDAIIAAASTTLTLNPSAKFACLVPRWSPNGTVCDFEAMWRGMAYLAIKEGAATKFNVQEVREHDHFEGNPDNDSQPVTHRIFSFDRGAVRGYYCTATMLDGTKVAEFMSVEQIEKIRDRSDGYKAYVAKKTKSNPWASDFSEMAKKTILKRSIKRLPLGKKESLLYKVIDLDNRDYSVSDAPRNELKAAKPKALPELTKDHPKWKGAVKSVHAGATRKQAEANFTISDDTWKALTEQAAALEVAQDLAQTPAA